MERDKLSEEWKYVIDNFLSYREDNNKLQIVTLEVVGELRTRFNEFNQQSHETETEVEKIQIVDEEANLYENKYKVAELMETKQPSESLLNADQDKQEEAQKEVLIENSDRNNLFCSSMPENPEVNDVMNNLQRGKVEYPIFDVQIINFFLRKEYRNILIANQQLEFGQREIDTLENLFIPGKCQDNDQICFIYIESFIINNYDCISIRYPDKESKVIGREIKDDWLLLKKEGFLLGKKINILFLEDFPKGNFLKYESEWNLTHWITCNFNSNKYMYPENNIEEILRFTIQKWATDILIKKKFRADIKISQEKFEMLFAIKSKSSRLSTKTKKPEPVPGYH